MLPIVMGGTRRFVIGVIYPLHDHVASAIRRLAAAASGFLTFNLSIDGDGRDREGVHGLDDRGHPIIPIEPTSREDPHPVAVTTAYEPIAVVLELVGPISATALPGTKRKSPAKAGLSRRFFPLSARVQSA
jgi:hypothetical protein